MTLTKIGNNLLLTDGKGQKLASTKDAMTIVNLIRQHHGQVKGLDNLPEYYRNMVSPVLHEGHVAQLTVLS